MNSFEGVWALLLSHDPKRIQKAIEDLSNEDQQAVIDHLKKMTSEEGWHPAQMQSAQIALDIINKQK